MGRNKTTKQKRRAKKLWADDDDELEQDNCLLLVQSYSDTTRTSYSKFGDIVSE